VIEKLRMKNEKLRDRRRRLASTPPTRVPGRVAPPAGRGWRIEDGKWLLKNIKNDKTNPINFRFSIYDLRASWSIAQAFSFGVPKTKGGHNKTCNFAKRSQIPRRLVFHSSCYEAGCCERFMVIFPKGDFEKRSQFLHLRFAEQSPKPKVQAELPHLNLFKPN
jgi:hypothetical protein